MTREQLQALTSAYTGQIKQRLPGDRAIRVMPRNLWQCQCGCHGDFTEHSMRAGESGRCASVIIR